MVGVAMDADTGPASFISDPERSFDRLPTLEEARPTDRQVVLPRKSDAEADRPIDHLLERCPAVDTLLAYRRFVVARPQPQIRCLYSARESLDRITLANLPGLRAASFAAAAKDVDLEWLPPELEHLGGFSHAFGDFKVIGRLAGLRTLKIWDPAPRAIAPISRLKYLRRLYLGSGSFGLYRDQRLGTASALGKLENLEDVVLFGLTAKDLSAFSGWTRVRRLLLRTSGRLDGIEAMVALEELEVDGMGMQDSCPALAPIAALQRLWRLYIKYHRAPPDLDRIGLPSALRSLRLDFGWLAGCELPSARTLLTLANLEDLYLFLYIGDGKVSQLRSLIGLKSLTVLGAYARDEVEALRRALPNCKLDVDAWEEPPAPVEHRRAGIFEYYRNDDGTWVVFQDLTEPLDTDDNHDAEDLIRGVVERDAPGLLDRLEFDSESSMFAVRVAAEADLVELGEVIGRALAHRLKEPQK